MKNLVVVRCGDKSLHENWLKGNVEYDVAVSYFGDDFKFDQSILVLAMIVVGGLGSLPGAIIGAVLLISLPEVLRPIGDYRMLIVGLIMFVVILFLPKGLWAEATALKWIRTQAGLKEGWK